MKMNRKWRPDGYSVQARELAEKVFDNVYGGYDNAWTLKDAYHFFNISYRAPLVVYRAVKIFNRKIKKRR